MATKTTVAMGGMFLVAVWFGFQAWVNQAGILASSALAFNTERYFLAAIIMGLVCLVTRVRITWRAVRAGLVVGVAFGVLIALESQSLALGSAGRVTFLGGLFVAVMPFVGHFIRSEKLYPAAVFGSGVMLFGAWRLLFVPDGSSLGDGYAVLRAAACGVLVLVLKRCGGEDWRVMGLVNFSVVALISLIIAGISGQTRFSLQPEVLLPVAVSAIVGSIICMTVIQWCERQITSAVSGVMWFLDSPFSVIFGVLLGKELLTASSILAYAIIATGAILVLTAGTLRLPQFKLSFAQTRIVPELEA